MVVTLAGFSTSTTAHNIAAFASCMSMPRAHFAHDALELACGIPQVTLLGIADDWRRLRSKVEHLRHFNLEGENLMLKWLRMLQPICDNFVRCAESEGMEVDALFWDTVCHHLSGGSGAEYLSGWVTAFSVFDREGKWQAERLLPGPTAFRV